MVVEILVKDNISDSKDLSSAQRFFFLSPDFLPAAGSFAWVVHLQQDVI